MKAEHHIEKLESACRIGNGSPGKALQHVGDSRKGTDDNQNRRFEGEDFLTDEPHTIGGLQHSTAELCYDHCAFTISRRLDGNCRPGARRPVDVRWIFRQFR